mmetsp:Transcript_34903/g.73406  ORF Transcript_34903/g.73406 Transcript_34903/m.73406 type:complete len:304 (-) Transcript_34903:165-1076(-)
MATRAAAALRLAAGAGAIGALAAASQTERLLVAYHEAGHAIVGRHFQESGLCGNRLQGKIHSYPLLRYVTCTPRESKPGIIYMGETKLAVRWRHMHQHATFRHVDTVHHPEATTTELHILQTEEFRRHSCLKSEAMLLLGLARLTYVFGGRAAEDLLWGGPPKKPDGSVDASKGVERILAHPGRASGDLRQIQRLVGKMSKCAHDEEEDCKELMRIAYLSSHDVVALHWPQVQALAGALFALGTLNGVTCNSLFADLTPQSKGEQHTLLQALQGRPFLYGLAWGIFHRKSTSSGGLIPPKKLC